MEKIMANGHVDAFIIGPDGSRQQVVMGANTLLYRCADAVARMFSGMLDYTPTTIGFVCADASDTDLSSKFNFTTGDRTTKTQDELVLEGLTVHDVQIGQNKQFAPTGDTYTGNKVTLGTMTTENTKAEDVYGFLLKDASGRVLAVKKLDAKVKRSANYALAVSWTVTFN